MILNKRYIYIPTYRIVMISCWSLIRRDQAFDMEISECIAILLGGTVEDEIWPRHRTLIVTYKSFLLLFHYCEKRKLENDLKIIRKIIGLVNIFGVSKISLWYLLHVHFRNWNAKLKILFASQFLMIRFSLHYSEL